MKVLFKERPCSITIQNLSFDPDYWCDAYISEAFWIDTGEYLNLGELDEINDELLKNERWITDYLY